MNENSNNTSLNTKTYEFKTHDMEAEESILKETGKPVIKDKPKKPCPHCKAENRLHAKRCFICGKELNNLQENERELGKM